MALSRDMSLRIAYVLDDCIPPAIRDSKILMYPMMWLVFRRHTREVMRFKDRAFSMTEEEFAEVYERTQSVMQVQGETDLNARCIEAIQRSIVGESVLEVGVGRGYLANLLAENYAVTGVDIAEPKRSLNVPFKVANIESLPFADGSFDTVVCTHTLEHVQRVDLAIKELRRVGRHMLLVVVPKQRPYRYTFNLHLQYFPYSWSFEAAFGSQPGAQLQDLGDWFYCEPLEVVRQTTT